MTVHYFKYTEIPSGRFFRLQVNHDAEMTRAPDARWIDLDTGLELNIVALSYDLNLPTGPAFLSDGLGRRVQANHVLPLWETTFEGVRVGLPFRYKDMLRREFGEKSMSELPQSSLSHLYEGADSSQEHAIDVPPRTGK